MTERPSTADSPTWYQLSAAEVMESLGMDRAGLTSSEARARLAKYGYNELKFKRHSLLTRFLLQFRSALIYVLLAAAIITAFLSGSCQRHNRLRSGGKG